MMRQASRRQAESALIDNEGVFSAEALKTPSSVCMIHEGMTMFDRVFYVSYGSNLLESRFQEYIENARWMKRGEWDEEMLDEYPASYRVNLARDTYYAMGSARWGGGIAFLDIDKFSAKKVYRAYDLRSEEHTSELQSRFELVCRL